MKKWIVLLLSVICTLSLISCGNTKDSEPSYWFAGEIVGVSEGSVVIQVTDYGNHKFGSTEVVVHQMKPELGYAVGDLVKVEFDGVFLETYPPQIKNPMAVTKIESAGNVSPTQTEEKDPVLEYLVREGNQYLVMPISREEVRVWEEHTQHLSKIDLDLLKAAEEKLAVYLAEDSNNSGFYLQLKDGVLHLCVEVIVDIIPPQTVTMEDGYVLGSGCGIDHDHVFYMERIVK